MLTTLTLLAGLHQAAAQVTFAPTSSYAVGRGPNSVTAADVNGDGKVDLICANYSDNTLSVLTNNGSSGFGSNATYTVSNGPASVVAADVNGDGKPDLISANYGSISGNGNTLSVLTNNGNSSFFLASSPSVGSGPISVIAADVNGDGKPDLISANYQGGNGYTISVVTNKGSGIFSTAHAYYVFVGVTSVVAADVNGDGKMDLISSGVYANSTLSVYTNNGSGSFTLASSPFGGPVPESVTAADVNGDGWVDLICANEFASTLTALTNNGSGGFGSNATYTVGNGPYQVVAEDVNGDGKMDLITANHGISTSGNTLSVLTNDGSGCFVLASSPQVGNRPASVVAADVNGDGHLDLISANAADNTLSVLISVPTLISKLSGNSVLVSWPSDWTNWTLQQNPDLTTTNWSASGDISDDGTNKNLAIPSPAGNLFFRLSHL